LHTPGGVIVNVSRLAEPKPMRGVGRAAILSELGSLAILTRHERECGGSVDYVGAFDRDKRRVGVGMAIGISEVHEETLSRLS
jgi:hypothetical protein